MTYEERMKWFREARFGIYVHFGLYSILGRGEWTMYSERIPAAEYAQLADQFNPAPGCAKEWVETAKAAGAKYMVLTTRHHEGFCLFDSQYSDFTSVKHGCKRDIVREYVDAAREAGLKVGLYYSLLDWRFPGYFEPEKYPQSKEALLTQIHGQVRELQPTIIINDRSGKKEDIETPEQVVRAGKELMTESCMCIGDSCAWGYTRFNPNWKTSEQLLQHLIQAAQLDGNYLLNIGPDPQGHIRNEEIERIQQVGIWLQKNGEAVYNSERCDLIGSSQPGLVDLNLQGPWTRKGNIGYWCIFRWPGNTATAVMVDTPVKRVTLLATGEEFKFQWNAMTGRLQIFGLPALPPDPLASVLKVEFEDIPRRKKEVDLSSWISGN